MDGFVHLHVHSHYSLLDGCAQVEDLVSTAQSLGMNALAVTDHGNLFGAMEFYQAATDAGVKPILGMEAYISPTTRQDRSMGRIDTAAYHLLLLAMNAEGWANLMKLSSRAYLEGFYYRPRVDRELLAECHKGLICTTACLKGEVPAALLAGQMAQARKIAGEYRDIFGKDRFFLEVQNADMPEQRQTNPLLVKLAEELGVGVVGTNDVHFLRAEDRDAHTVLTCISTGKTLQSADKLEYPPELYLKDPAAMRKALAEFPTAADNTLRIAEMCNARLDLSRQYLPHFHVPDGRTPEEELRRLARAGLAGRFEGQEVPAHYRERLESELGVIEKKGYSSYFLIVNDFVQYARANGIPAAPRGSGVGTLLGYALGIADVDPIRYGLLFERFTDPARSEAPDMDIDMCQVGRDRVIQYVRQKYGHVAQIITFGTLKARAVVRDVGRVMDLPLAEVDAIAKLVPETLGMTLAGALEIEPRLRERCEKDPRVRQLLEYGQKLEGLARHAGVHAAGVIVAQQPLETIVPLCRQADSEDAMTQWDGETCTKAGLMKMDFLGLSTLSILERARKLVRQRTGKDIDPEKVPLDDPAVYELFQKGLTDGVFQFESGGMKNILVQMKPTRIEDLIAANAMYRPGPMELIPAYCSRKHGLEPVEPIHPVVDDILAETYGIMAYQEQVMMVLNRLGKLPLGRAYALIKAISKKKEKIIASEKPNFLAGARENGLGQKEAEDLFELILRFAGYGFNKSHSTRYAIIAYQTAYFKVHYPAEFLAAVLTFESGDTDKVVLYRAEAERMGVAISRPDVNTCEADFTPEGGGIRYGLAAVKGIGARAVEALVEARKAVGRFTDLYHFCQNVDLHAVNRSALEALIKCGAFDGLGAHRGAMMAALDHAIELGQSAAAARRSGQMSLLEGLAGAEPPKPQFPDVEPWSEAALLAAEKETLGFFLSSHPLVHFGRELTGLSSPPGTNLAKLDQFAHGAPVTVGCMIAGIRLLLTKSGRSAGKQMAMLTLEDLTGKGSAVAFAETYEQIAGLLTDQALLFVTGTVDRQRERPSIIIRDVVPLEQALEKLTGSILLRLTGPACAGRLPTVPPPPTLPGISPTPEGASPPPLAASRGETAIAPVAGSPGAPGFPAAGSSPAPAPASPDILQELSSLLAAHKGACPVYIQLRPAGRPDVRATVRADRQWSVTPCRALIEALEKLLGGQEYLTLTPRPPAPASNGNGYRNGFGRGNGHGDGNGGPNGRYASNRAPAKA